MESLVFFFRGLHWEKKSIFWQNALKKNAWKICSKIKKYLFILLFCCDFKSWSLDLQNKRKLFFTKKIIQYFFPTIIFFIFYCLLWKIIYMIWEGRNKSTITLGTNISWSQYILHILNALFALLTVCGWIPLNNMLGLFFWLWYDLWITV